MHQESGFVRIKPGTNQVSFIVAHNFGKMLILQSSKSRSVCLLMFEVKRDSLGDVILLTSQGVFFTEVQEGLISYFGKTIYTTAEIL